MRCSRLHPRSLIMIQQGKYLATRKSRQADSRGPQGLEIDLPRANRVANHLGRVNLIDSKSREDNSIKNSKEGSNSNNSNGSNRGNSKRGNNSSAKLIKTRENSKGNNRKPIVTIMIMNHQIALKIRSRIILIENDSRKMSEHREKKMLIVNNSIGIKKEKNTRI